MVPLTVVVGSRKSPVTGLMLMFNALLTTTMFVALDNPNGLLMQS
jgi:hypothetical protein